MYAAFNKQYHCITESETVDGLLNKIVADMVRMTDDFTSIHNMPWVEEIVYYGTHGEHSLAASEVAKFRDELEEKATQEFRDIQAEVRS